MAASKALAKGDWETTNRHISNIKIWEMMPGAMDINEIKAMLTTYVRFLLTRLPVNN